MPPSIERDSNDSVTLSMVDESGLGQAVGSIEVVEVLVEGGNVVSARILCMPPEDEHLPALQSLLTISEEHAIDEEEDDDDGSVAGYDEDGVGIELSTEEATTLSNSFLDTLLYGCVGCEPCNVVPLYKGILKDPNALPSDQVLGDRNVSFSSLDIKEFNLTLGDHPSASSGPPVRLGDKPVYERTISLEDYEQTRCPRRKRRQLKLSYRDRKGILEDQEGFSTKQVNEAWAEALKIRQQRHETLKRGLLLMTFDDVWESAQRKCKRVAESMGMA